uniref:SUMO-activating enzyme subunit n=1 Tax=Aceria tosichella TaxID=561515 RepID=A0A6G1SQK5_9ACAR
MDKQLRDKIERCKVLLVGAGGIGCEVLKNLTLTGFKNIDAIDLDTIDVSNLNRQFLFNKSNVGQSKSEVAIEIAKREYAPTQDGLNLKAIHKSITLSEFDVDFFRQYSFVINALDNRAARSHVNRMCLAAEIPLLESGTAGYTGQLKLIKNSLYACYECDGLQKEGRTFATCTIRNTPSQPIHCIVWAKHLFHQLFGEDDPDNDVSPQMEQQANGSSHTSNGTSDSTNNGTETEAQSEIDSSNKPKSISTREWANTYSYDPLLLFEKLYNYDIKYLLSMDNLWKERARPSQLDYTKLTQDQGSTSAESNNGFKLGNQRLWTLKECVEVFCDSVNKLYDRLKTSGYQHWDKDDEVALNFVVAASNLRSKCFNIERKSPFDVKSLAGNIVPAISSTNSIVGGLLVLQAIRLLKSIPVGEEYRKMNDAARNELLKDTGKMTFVNFTSLTRKDLISSYECAPPVPTCLGCSRGNVPEIEVHLSMKDTTLADLVDKVIINTLAFVCPDIGLNDDSGIIIWSKDEETEDPESSSKNKQRRLIELPHIKPPKTRLLISDLIQDKQIVMVLIDELIDEEKHNNFFYARLNGDEV